MQVYHQQYEPTGIKAVDIVIACVCHYRKIGRPLYAVVLHPKLYGIFQIWVAGQSGEEAAEGQFFFDTVEIKQGSTLMIDRLYCEFDKPREYEHQHNTEKFNMSLT